MMPKINTSKYKKRIEPFIDVRVFGLIIFGVIMVLVSWSGLKVLQTNYELEKKISQLSHRNTVQQLENENLKLKNKYLESDQYLELTARRQFNKAAKGEKLYLVPKEAAMSSTANIPTEKPNTTKSDLPKSKYQENLDDWRNFLFNR